jgi:ER degradation enhancer, mannosidase alpha-like 2
LSLALQMKQPSHTLLKGSEPVTFDPLFSTTQDPPVTSKRATVLGIVLTVFTFSATSQQLSSEQLANRVKTEFQHFWKGYISHGQGYDGYAPLSMKPENRFGAPFYLTALHALDALCLMRLDAEVDSTREFLARNLSFDKDVFVPTAEFGGGVLGALIASYQLTSDKRLLDLADDLGARLVPAFVTPTAMPYREVNLKTGAVRGEVCSPAEVGALLMDLGALTMVTGKPAYFNHAKIAILQLYDRRSPIDLVGESINITTGEWEKKSSNLGPAIGPYYEDVLKSTYLFEDGDCAQIWQAHYAAITRYLLDSTAKGSWYGQADMETGKRTAKLAGTYDVFLPIVQTVYKDFDRAERSMLSFSALWTTYGFQPELYNYGRGKIENPGFSFGPKFTEALYSLYRTSGEAIYLQLGKGVLDSLEAYCRIDQGYAALKSVVDKTRVDRLDPASFIATMRNLYLLYSPPDVLDFGRVILDPQGHPIRKAW